MMNAQQWVSKIESSLPYSANVFLYINNKKLIETDFAGDRDLLSLVARELLDANKTPKIRHQRLGVWLSIAYGIHKDLLIKLLLSPCATLSKLIASHIHTILDENEILDLFDHEEKFMEMNERTRLNIERCIRKNCKGLIVRLVKKLMNRVQPRECVHLLAHLPSFTPDQDLLKELQPMRVQTSVLVRKHPNVVVKLLRGYLDEVVNASPKNLRTKRASSLLGTHSFLFSQLIKYRSEEAWNIVNEYLIEPSVQEQLPPLDGSSYLQEPTFYKLPSFTETFVRCIPLFTNPPVLHCNKWNRMTANQIARIGCSIIEHFKFEPSQHAQSFIADFFEVNSNMQFRKRRLVFEKMFSNGLSKEKLAYWIYANCENEKTPPEYLANYPPEISSQVSKKMYEIRKTQTFQNASEESVHWKYFYDLNDETLYKQFKSVTSSPQPAERPQVIQDLLFCALYSGVKVKETLEWLETRLKNDDDTCQNLLFVMNYSNVLNQLVVQAFRDKECIQNFISIFENSVTRKPNLAGSVQRFYSTLVNQLAYDIEVVKPVVESSFLKSIFKDATVIFSTLLKPEIHKTLWNVILPSVKNQITTSGDVEAFSSFITNVVSLKKQEHVKKAFSTFFDEWFHECVKNISHFHRLEDLIDIYIFKLDPSPSTITSKVQHLLNVDSRLISISAIQRALLGRNTHFETNFLYQYLRDHAMSVEEFENLTPFSSQTVMTVFSESCITFHPIVLNGLRLYEYSTREVTHRLLSTFKDLLRKVVKTSEIENIYHRHYLSQISLVKKSIKMLRHLCVEQDEMDDFSQFLQDHILKRDKYEQTNEDETEISNLEDNAARCLAELVRVYSQDPTQYFDWILENISSENVLYYSSSLYRISTFMNAQPFIQKYCVMLKEKFDSLSQSSSQQAPKNFSISIQKLFISLLKNYIEYPVKHPIMDSISNLLIYLWEKNLHKDVQVKLVETALKATKYCQTQDLFNTFKKIFQDALSHKYSEVVTHQVSYSRSNNLQVARDLFTLNLNALNHTDAAIQTKVWALTSNAVSAFDVSAITPTFHPFDVFQNYIISAALTFNMAQKHDISNTAIDVLLNELDGNNPGDICQILFEKIITPLMTEEQFQVLDRETYNATTPVWDRPVSQRVQHLAHSIAHRLASKFDAIHPDTLKDIQNKLVLPWIELCKKSPFVENRIPYVSLISSATNWKSKDSVIENCVKRVVDYLKDVKEPLRSVYLVQIASNVSTCIFHDEMEMFSQTMTILEAIGDVIENEIHYSDEEVLMASGILVTLSPNDRTRDLLRKVRRKQNALIKILVL
nr:unnamed protein product [Naegleria fowleri]